MYYVLETNQSEWAVVMVLQTYHFLRCQEEWPVMSGMYWKTWSQCACWRLGEIFHCGGILALVNPNGGGQHAPEKDTLICHRTLLLRFTCRIDTCTRIPMWSIQLTLNYDNTVYEIIQGYLCIDTKICLLLCKLLSRSQFWVLCCDLHLKCIWVNNKPFKSTYWQY